jgi:hypothetical protein
MIPANFYPGKPQLGYKKTIVSLEKVADYLNTTGYPVEVKRATYVIFGIESGNGQHGINNNYCGAQADSGKWPGKYDGFIVGTVLQYENGTGKLRRFLAFSDYTASIMFLADRLLHRGIYIGGTTYKIVKMTPQSPAELALAYTREWITGNPKSNLDLNILKAVVSRYNDAKKALG